MKIAVCIKQVPTRDWQPRLNEQHTWIRDQDAAFEMNEPDAYALEEALRLKEKHGGEVVVCSAGPAVLTIQSGINQLRYATLKGIMAAKKKDIRKAAPPAGLTPRLTIAGLYAPEKVKKTAMISGSPAEAARELVRRLREDARVI